MDLTFQKHFEDRYTQSREHQILDYLNQRGAAVPKVILSHAEARYLEMSHAGQNLTQWLGQQRQVDSIVFEVLAESTRILLEVSQLGIWHLDVAPRNFVVHSSDDESTARVCLIDFGNAVSPLFPLQKPLWMRPSAEQHRLLRQALQLDWQAFYRRHGLIEPADWEQSFEVPEATYQVDWTSQLQVEALAARPCVLAHGLGHMLRSSARILDWTSVHRNDLGLSLLNLEDDEQALLGIRTVHRQFQAWAQAWRPTPRPTRRSEPLAVEPPAVELSRAVASGGALTSALEPPLSSASEKIVPEPASAPSGTQIPPGRSAQRRWLPILTSATVMVVGWVMLELIYQAASGKPGAPLKTTALALGGVSLAVLGSIVGLGGLLWSQQKMLWWRRLLYAHVLGQGLLVLELWVLQLPNPVLWFAMASPLLLLLLTAIGPSRAKPKT